MGGVRVWVWNLENKKMVLGKYPMRKEKRVRALRLVRGTGGPRPDNGPRWVHDRVGGWGVRGSRKVL